MIYTVSTIKDATANVERFIARNLVSGADHMFVFLEGPAAGRQARRLTGEHVTAIPTGGDYWQGRRPRNLNARQVVNANLANTALAGFGWADWLFHIDGDECLDMDGDYLKALGPDVHAVKLRSLEVVSDTEPPAFKRTLRRRELWELHRMGLIASPSNRAYFRGHTVGKAGLRPSLLLSPRVHTIKTHNHAKLHHQVSGRLRVLHYESPTGVEFIRKWTAHVAKGNMAAFRPERRIVADAIRAVLSGGHTPEQTSRHLWAMYEGVVRDRYDTLDALGLLVTPDERFHDYTPTPHTGEQRRLLSAMLSHLAAADKRYFWAGFPTHQPRDWMRTLLASLHPGDVLTAHAMSALSR